MDEAEVTQWTTVLGQPISCICSSKFCDHQLLQQYNELLTNAQVRCLMSLLFLTFLCRYNCSVNVWDIVAMWLERWTINKKTFESIYQCFKAWTISFTPLCRCLSEGTLKAVYVLPGVYAKGSQTSYMG